MAKKNDIIVKLPTKPALFVQEWGMPKNETLVAYDVPYRKFMEILHKFKMSKDVIAIMSSPEEEQKAVKRGMAFINFEGNKSILFIFRHDDLWNMILSVLHETNHLAFIGIHQKRCNGDGEPEFVAYTQENLFDEIFKKLDGRTPIPKDDDYSHLLV